MKNNSQQDAGRLNSEMNDKPLKKYVNYFIPAGRLNKQDFR